jgi:hypothetical protein
VVLITKAQFAMEYMLVVAFSLALLLPVTSLIYDEYQKSREEVNAEHLTEVTRELVYQAERVYFQGAPSTMTVTVTLPNGVESFIVSEHSIDIKLMDNPISIYADTTVDLAPAVLYNFSGPHNLAITMDDLGTADPADDVVRITDQSR